MRSQLLSRAISVYARTEVRWYLLLILTISAANSYIFLTHIDPENEFGINPQPNNIIGISATIATVMSFVALHRQIKQKTLLLISTGTLTFLTIALCLNLAAEWLWSYYVIVYDIEEPFPSAADYLWLTGYGFFAVVLYKVLYSLLPFKISVKDKPKGIWYLREHQHLLIIVPSTLLIVGVLISYLGVVVWSAYPDHELIVNSILNIGFSVTLAYPIFSSILLVPCAAILWKLKGTEIVFTHWVLFTAFFVFLIIGDFGFALSEILVTAEFVTEEQTHTWIWDTFYNSAYICMAFALYWYYRYSIAVASKVILP